MNKLVNRYYSLQVNLLTAMPKPKGGRGIKAPYETTHLRVPLPIKPQVESLINHYKEEGELPTENLLTDLDSAIVLAKSILNQKKSARVSLEKLLTAIYKQKVLL